MSEAAVLEPRTTLPATVPSSESDLRVPEAAVDPMFLARWSPRAFLPTPVPHDELRSIFEAARWAPSDRNEQPWRFLYATTASDRARFLEGLFELNRLWAQEAPVLVYLLVRKNYRAGPSAGTPNPTARFDAGAAWMALALQAHRLGVSAHAMGGIDREKVHELLGIPREEFDVLVAIALGYRGDPAKLPPMMREREQPSPRMPLAEVATEGSLNGNRPEPAQP